MGIWGLEILDSLLFMKWNWDGLDPALDSAGLDRAPGLHGTETCLIIHNPNPWPRTNVLCVAMVSAYLDARSFVCEASFTHQCRSQFISSCISPTVNTPANPRLQDIKDFIRKATDRIGHTDVIGDGVGVSSLSLHDNTLHIPHHITSHHIASHHIASHHKKITSYGSTISLPFSLDLLPG